jgi:hypothetical protein
MTAIEQYTMGKIRPLEEYKRIVGLNMTTKEITYTGWCEEGIVSRWMYGMVVPYHGTSLCFCMNPASHPLFWFCTSLLLDSSSTIIFIQTVNLGRKQQDNENKQYAYTFKKNRYPCVKNTESAQPSTIQLLSMS